jgi:hypothetical protein
MDDADLLSPKSGICKEIIDADNPQTPEEVIEPFNQLPTVKFKPPQWFTVVFTHVQLSSCQMFCQRLSHI